jgi:hypothetical protein
MPDLAGIPILPESDVAVIGTPANTAGQTLTALVAVDIHFEADVAEAAALVSGGPAVGQVWRHGKLRFPSAEVGQRQ